MFLHSPALTAFFIASVVVAMSTTAGAVEVISIVAEQPAQFDGSACVWVSWSGATGDTYDDWISAWWVPYKATYIQFFNAPQVPSNRTCFTLLNARHPYVFKYYRGDTLLATSNEVVPNAAYPMHLRMTVLPGDATTLRISWISNRSLGNHTVAMYGSEGAAELDKIAIATADTFTHDDIVALVGEGPIPQLEKPFPNIGLRALRCGTTYPTNASCFTDRTAAEQYVDPGILHTAVLTELRPGQRFYYRVGELTGPMSPVHYANTPLPPGADGTASIILMADGGFGDHEGSFAGGALDNKHKRNGAQLVFSALYQAYNFTNDGVVYDDLALFNGDLSYAQGWPYAWEYFHHMTAPLYRHVALVPGYGNHEVDWKRNPYTDFEVRGSDSGGECGLVAKKRFNIDSPYYVTRTGALTIITLSSEHNLTEQVTWFREVVMPSLNRSVTPWVVVQIHRPIYASSFTELLTLQMRQAYRGLFVEAGVALVYTGHIHYYERLCPISNDNCADYPFRDVWTRQGTVSVPTAPAPSCVIEVKTFELTLEDCRAACANANLTKGCSAILHSHVNFSCTLLRCVDGVHVSPTPTWDITTLWTMTRLPGRAPVYIIDGVAGAESQPQWTPGSPLTRYKDFDMWGWSRIRANRTHMHFLHYHRDGAVHDEQVFSIADWM